jgi:hypothetical protein
VTKPKVTGSVIVSDLKQGAEAIRDLILPSMMEPSFTDAAGVHRPLRLIAQHLLDHPESLPSTPWTPHLNAILQQFVLDHPRPKPDNAAIAGAVDQLLLFSTKTFETEDGSIVSKQALADARRKVADALGVDISGVKKAHQRFGKYRA